MSRVCGYCGQDCWVETQKNGRVRIHACGNYVMNLAFNLIAKVAMVETTTDDYQAFKSQLLEHLLKVEMAAFGERV